MENRCEGCRWFRKNDAPASDWCNYNPEIVYKGESSYACSKFEPKESPAKEDFISRFPYADISMTA